MHLRRDSCLYSLGFFAIVVLEGCSVLYSVVEGISSSADHDVVPGRTLSLAYCEVTDIQLVTDSSTISGTLVGVETLDSSTYCMKWDEWAKEAGVDLRLGDSVDAIRHELLLGDVSGRLRGISEGILHLQSAGEPRSIAVSAIRELKTERGTWSGRAFQKIVSGRPPPAMMCLSVLTYRMDKVVIPVDEIRGGEYQRSFDGWGLLVTVPIDIAVIVAVVSSPPSFRMGGPP
jgi:hypothetical protein